MSDAQTQRQDTTSVKTRVTFVPEAGVPRGLSEPRSAYLPCEKVAQQQSQKICTEPLTCCAGSCQRVHVKGRSCHGPTATLRTMDSAVMDPLVADHRKLAEPMDSVFSAAKSFSRLPPEQDALCTDTEAASQPPKDPAHVRVFKDAVVFAPENATKCAIAFQFCLSEEGDPPGTDSVLLIHIIDPMPTLERQSKPDRHRIYKAASAVVSSAHLFMGERATTLPPRMMAEIAFTRHPGKATAAVTLRQPLSERGGCTALLGPCQFLRSRVYVAKFLKFSEADDTRALRPLRRLHARVDRAAAALLSKKTRAPIPPSTRATASTAAPTASHSGNAASSEGPALSSEFRSETNDSAANSASPSAASPTERSKLSAAAPQFVPAAERSSSFSVHNGARPTDLSSGMGSPTITTASGTGTLPPSCPPYRSLPVFGPLVEASVSLFQTPFAPNSVSPLGNGKCYLDCGARERHSVAERSVLCLRNFFEEMAMDFVLRRGDFIGPNAGVHRHRNDSGEKDLLLVSEWPEAHTDEAELTTAVLMQRSGGMIHERDIAAARTFGGRGEVLRCLSAAAPAAWPEVLKPSPSPDAKHLGPAYCRFLPTLREYPSLFNMARLHCCVDAAAGVKRPAWSMCPEHGGVAADAKAVQRLHLVNRSDNVVAQLLQRRAEVVQVLRDDGCLSVAPFRLPVVALRTSSSPADRMMLVVFPPCGPCLVADDPHNDGSQTLELSLETQKKVEDKEEENPTEARAGPGNCNENEDRNGENTAALAAIAQEWQPVQAYLCTATARLYFTPCAGFMLPRPLWAP